MELIIFSTLQLRNTELGANIGQEAIHTPTFTGSKGKPLKGSNNYTVNINPLQTIPL
jgi:hypothetical protein